MNIGYTSLEIANRMKLEGLIPCKNFLHMPPNRYCLLGVLGKWTLENFTEDTDYMDIVRSLNIEYECALQMSFGWDDAVVNGVMYPPKEPSLAYRVPYYNFGYKTATLVLSTLA